MGETHARRRIGNADKVIASGALYLATGELRFALERLITVGAVKLEFVCIHGLCPNKRKCPGKSISKSFHTFYRQNPLGLVDE